MDDDEFTPKRRFLHAYRAGGNATSLLDRALLAALIYIAFGVVYTGLHIPVLVQVESVLNPQFTVFADLIAVAATVALWPLLLGSALVCGAAGCGVL
ncbi:hypothetical protein CRI77_01460 [Mycolicibacterium duvalii]|uniref:Uncharacterized protein n=1 Tax=Mycolicibacterium duvalii TaxID=39688 RepID=A0A7I7K5P2_9MYCO|nr:hypothetical protein [Mycolicibacterium duvalii]MCV7367609.1 hypothetical protein [Mycolicibacterium duvalii]PEG44085.1 hypothetical protein CRI77_01460 [Mycolicibacterium duvalii]BBX18801.1 hypothetical protein MDUV_36610 [Mycolicibacterium duvalii]